MPQETYVGQTVYTPESPSGLDVIGQVDHVLLLQTPNSLGAGRMVTIETFKAMRAEQLRREGGEVLDSIFTATAAKYLSGEQRNQLINALLDDPRVMVVR